MSMFPGTGAIVYTNEAGEPLGWDTPAYDEPYDDVDSWYEDYDEGDDPENDASELEHPDDRVVPLGRTLTECVIETILR